MGKAKLDIKDLKEELLPHFNRMFPLGQGGDKMRLLDSTLQEVTKWLVLEKQEEKTMEQLDKEAAEKDMPKTETRSVDLGASIVVGKEVKDAGK